MILKHAKKAILFFAILAIGLTQSVIGQTNTLYNFNTAGQLSTYFNGYGSGQASITQETSGGIGNTGYLKAPNSSVDAIYATKDAYSMGPVGSSYTFQCDIRSTGNSGYGGMGFTSNSPATATAGMVFRPSDALGVSVHGGGFVFHNGATDISGSWNSSSSGSLTAVKASTCSDLINSTSTTCGSPDRWYRIIFKIVRASSTTFNMRVEVWPSDVSGTLRYPSAATAIYEVNGITNTTITNSAKIHSYFNFSGQRLTGFDNYSINLAGGASVIQAGMPVVLTTSSSESNGVVTVNGNVTSENGSSVTERGFVYGTSTNPTISNNKVVLGSGTGTFSGTTPTLASGTYYFRAYATNSTGTSYGAQEQHTISAPITAPNITSFTPKIAGNGEQVVINGTGFTGVTIVKFGTVNAKSFTVDSDTKITAVVGAAKSGDVFVQNSAGNDSESGFVFKIVDYNFNGNVLDVTDANLDGTINGGVTFGPGYEGQAACFDRSSTNWIKMPDDLIKNLTEFTISLRFKTNSKGVLLGYQNAAVDGNANQYIPIIVVQSDGKLRATLWTTANTDMSVVSTSVVNDGNWHKVDMSITSTSINIYVDGVLAGSTNSGTVAHLSMIYNQIGRGRTDAARESAGGNLTGWQGFTGCIDNFMILDKGQSLTTINEVTQQKVSTISTSGTLNAFSTCSGTASANQSFTVSGTDLAGDVIVTAPTGYEVSLQSATGYASSITITASGTLANTSVYVRLSSTATGTPSGNIEVSSTNATTKNVEVSGTVTSIATPVAEATQLFCTGPGIYKYARVIFNGLKNFSSANSIQVSEWRWFNGSTQISATGTTLTNPGGSNPSGEGVANIFDGSTSTKWLDFNIKSGNNTSTIVFTFPGQGYEISGYSWSTANDSPERDPSSWKVYVSNDGVNWTEVHVVNSYSATNSRFASAGSWNFVSPSSNTGSLTATASTAHTLKWYTTVTGGTASNTAPSIDLSVIGSTNHYVSQVNAAGCESPRKEIKAVVATAPKIAYSNSSFSFERTKAITTIQPTSTGGTVSSYSISTTLPAGLTFNTSTGAISGTPTEVSASTTYTVTATTAEGCTTTESLSIEIFNAVAPSNLNYSPASQTVRQGTAITNMIPSSAGGQVASYAINPALPAGLTLNPTTGVISGTLSTTQTGTVTYTITATNSGGSVEKTITLVYNTAPTDISLTPSAVNENAAVGTSVGTLSATDADTGDTFTYELVSGNGSTDNAKFKISSSSLITDAVFDFETKNSYSVRVKVTDAGGLSFEKSFTITVNDLDNEDTDGDGIEDSVEKGSDPANPVDTDGDGIPDFKDTDADNDGVPDSVERTEGTSPTDKTKYKDSDGDGVPDYVETQNGTDPNDPKKYKDSDGDGVPDYVEILDGTNPNSAVSFKDTDGGGVPDYVETKLYPLYGLPVGNINNGTDDNRDTDGDGVSDYAEIKAGTNPNDAPANLRFNPSSLTAEKGTAITMVIPGYQKGKPTSYSISPALPAGLTMNPTTGVISGTPTVLLIPAVTYTITASNNGGSTTATFTLGVNDVPPSALKLTPATQLSEQGKAITTMTPSSAGGPVVSYSISPALPTGLTFNTTTGVISGTRTQAITGTVTYTITATNSGGSTTSTVTFTYNSTPTDIATTKANIYEGNNIGDVIGLLSTTDVDNPETHTYTLVMSGTNAFDNKNFKISGNRLVADTTFNFAFKNTYTVRVRSTDSQGLFTEKNFTITISKRPVIYGTSSEAYIITTFQGTTNVTTTPVVSKGYSSQLDVQGDDIRSVSWSTGTGLSSTTSLRPIFKNGTTVNYVVTVTNIYGSTIDIPFTVTVKEDYFIKPTNILTTRKDGINDYFNIENIESYPDNEVTIYDRNGKILTRISNYNNRWDGKINGQFLSNDTYYYLIRFTKNAQAPVKGFITIINN